jgi:hypothetical protein
VVTQKQHVLHFDEVRRLSTEKISKTQRAVYKLRTAPAVCAPRIVMFAILVSSTVLKTQHFAEIAAV